MTDRSTAFDAFKHRDFAIFWSAAMISNIGSWMQSLAVPYVIYESTGSVRWVGLAAFLQLIPSVPVSPYGGALADRYPRRRVLLVSQVLFALLALALWLVWVIGWRNPWVLITPVALGGALSGINMPAWQGFVFDLVPPHLLAPAITMNSAQFNLSRSIGPVIAGVVLARFGPSWTFLVNALSFVAVIVALLLVHPKPAPKVRATGNAFRQMGEAIRYVRTRRDLQLPIAIMGLIGFFGHPLNTLLVPIGKRLFGYGSGGVGILTAGFGLGAGVGVLLMEPFRRRASSGRMIVVTLTAYAAAVVLFATSQNLAMGTVLLLPVGCMHLLCVSSMSVLMQTRTDESMRGRVMSLYLTSFSIAFPVGSLIISSVAAVIGLRTSIAAAGSMLIVVVVLLRRHNLRANLDRQVVDPIAVVTANDRAVSAAVGLHRLFAPLDDWRGLVARERRRQLFDEATDCCDVGDRRPNTVGKSRRSQDHLGENLGTEAVVFFLGIGEHLIEWRERCEIEDVAQITRLVAGERGQNLVGSEFANRCAVEPFARLERRDHAFSIAA